MNQQKQPDDPPAGGAQLDSNPPGQGHDGMAHGQDNYDAAATPTNDRQDTELATNRIKPGDQAGDKT